MISSSAPFLFNPSSEATEWMWRTNNKVNWEGRTEVTSCSTNDGSNRVAKTRQVDTENPKKAERRKVLLEEVCQSRQTEIKLGLYLVGMMKCRGRIGKGILWCVVDRKEGLRALFDSLPIWHTSLCFHWSNSHGIKCNSKMCYLCPGVPLFYSLGFSKDWIRCL